jgi:AraC family transcriptional regulator
MQEDNSGTGHGADPGAGYGTDRELRVARVIDYIFTHLDQDLSRRPLAAVAHYSAEHLPKLFKQVVGQSPKQYSLQLRLETAFHYLVIQPQRSVQEIGFDSGFTALSLFSRAMKSYFGHSPEQIRRLPHAQQMRLLHGRAGGAGDARGAGVVGGAGGATFRRDALLGRDISAGLPVGRPAGRPADHPEIQVVRKDAVRGCYVLAPFDAPTKITAAFQVLEGYAGQWGVPLYGIITPHLRNTYRAFLPIPADKAGGLSAGKAGGLPVALPLSLPLSLPGSRISGGLFACFSVTGDLRHTNKIAHYFYRRWLPASGYRIAGIAGFETFGQSPASVPYHELQRHIHIPIEPVR